MTKKITIGITASESRFQNYLDWIQGNNANIELITLSYETQNTDDVKRYPLIRRCGYNSCFL